MNLKEFSQVNKERCESPDGFNHSIKSWDASDWCTATLGELGEAANIVKKLNRARDGVPGNKNTPKELKEMLASEIADTFIYLDLFAQYLHLDLGEIVQKTFDKKSKEIGYTELIADKDGIPITEKYLKSRWWSYNAIFKEWRLERDGVNYTYRLDVNRLLFHSGHSCGTFKDVNTVQKLSALMGYLKDIR
jgi:NTP pyrophosphatase (non-canonical NTP hydrolase)